MQTISFEVDDLYYQELISQVGKENLSDFFKKVSEPYFLLNKKSDVPPMPNNRPYRLGALPNINIPDNFDEYLEKGEFDKFFGILKSDKSVSIDEMNNAIKMRGGQLNNF